MSRAHKACSDPHCPHVQPCPDHPRESWVGSQRRRRVGKSGWQQQRDAKRILRKYGGICHVCQLPGADEVDHVIPIADGGLDTDANKRPIHSKPCHARKSQQEAQRARTSA